MGIPVLRLLGGLMVAQDDRRESWVRVPEVRQMIAPGGAKPASADRWLVEPGVRREKIVFLAAAGRGPQQLGFVAGVAQAFAEREARRRKDKYSFSRAPLPLGD